MKVSELEGELLDMWVARAAGIAIKRRADGFIYTDEDHPRQWDPSTNWMITGPIIEREGISIQKDVEDYSEPEEPWYADCGVFWDLGATPLIAAMRAYVKYKFGDVVADL